MAERWLPVPGYPGYEVSDQGNIRSVDRVVIRSNGHRYTCKGRLLKPTPSHGYRVVHVSSRAQTGGRGLVQKVSVLVLKAFVGPPPFSGADARHLNDIQLDDRLANLAWGTRRQNMADAVRNGKVTRGERRSNAKLTTADVLAIRASVEPQRALAARYGVCQQVISEVVQRKTWRHV